MDRQGIIDTATAIAEEYRDSHDLTLSLRQMYYQFVARGLLPNGDKVYKRLGAVLTDARLSGEFPIAYLEDRGRSVGETDADNIRTVNEAIEEAADNLARLPFWLRYGAWYGQSTKVFVWIEKDALSGVLEKTCRDLGVGLFPCKGYPSISALAGWVHSTGEMLEDGEDALILYLGDHDPDGLQIPISAEETLRRIQVVENVEFDFTMKRIALTLDQIRKYKPPPMPAKESSARFAAYKRATGLKDAWELDALDPPVLQKLVKAEVAPYFDRAIYDANQEEARARRVEMIERITDDPDWIAEQMRRHLT